MDTPPPLNTGNRPGAATAASPAIRPPEQRVRVFVSSTLDELAAERAAAREAITQLRLAPILFESGARPYPPRELYRAYLAQSDIFFGTSSEADEVLEQLAQLLDKSLVQPQHANYFLRVALEAAPYLYGQEREVRMERLDREDANLRAALAWSKTDSNALQTGLRLVGTLAFYWFLRGSVSEGRTWLEGMLERTDATDRSAARGEALSGAGWLAWAEGDYEAASPRAEEGLSIARERGDKRGIAYRGLVLGLVRIGQRNSAAARPLLEESRTLFKELGDGWGEASTLHLLGLAAYFSGDRAGACVL
jgi:hypothetical protein